MSAYHLCELGLLDEFFSVPGLINIQREIIDVSGDIFWFTLPTGFCFFFSLYAISRLHYASPDIKLRRNFEMIPRSTPEFFISIENFTREMEGCLHHSKTNNLLREHEPTFLIVLSLLISQHLLNLHHSSIFFILSAPLCSFSFLSLCIFLFFHFGPKLQIANLLPIINILPSPTYKR